MYYLNWLIGQQAHPRTKNRRRRNIGLLLGFPLRDPLSLMMGLEFPRNFLVELDRRLLGLLF
jgi:hypothetical protein